MDSSKKTSVPFPLTAAPSGGSEVTIDSPAAQHAPTAPDVPAVEPNFLAHEVCEMLKFGRTTLYKLVKAGELVPLHITARIRVFPLSTIKAFLASKGGE